MRMLDTLDTLDTYVALDIIYTQDTLFSNFIVTDSLTDSH